MQDYKALIGIEKDKVKELCVVVPFCTKGMLEEFKIGRLSKGILCSSGNNELFTHIVTKMGSTFFGDAVLSLKGSACKDIVMFGACGAVEKEDGKSIGDIVKIEKAISQDSFVNVLLNRKPQDKFCPNETFLSSSSIKKAICLSVGSIVKEKEYLKAINDSSIDVVDLEASAFYAAANDVGLRAIAFLYVTDIVGEHSLAEAFGFENMNKIEKITKNAARTVYEMLDQYISRK